MTASSTTRSASSASTAQPPATETSPLLAKSVATSFAADDEIIERGSVDSYEGYGTDEGDKGREVEVYKPGKSSFGQTVSRPGHTHGPDSRAAVEHPGRPDRYRPPRLSHRHSTRWVDLWPHHAYSHRRLHLVDVSWTTWPAAELMEG